MPNQRKSPPPIVYILLLLSLASGGYWFSNSKKLNSDLAVAKGSSQPELGGSISDRASSGGKMLITAEATPQKQAGVQAFAAGDYATAAAQFQASLQKYRNDPETLIYLNNARVANSNAVKIAVSVPIGSNLNVAQEILRGVAQAQDEVNRRGGINGSLLQVEIANDDNDPQIARQIAEQFVKESQVLAVVGHNASSASLAAAPVYQQGKLVMMTPTSSAQELTGFGDYIFRAVPSYRFQADALAHHIVQRENKTKIAICFDGNAPEKTIFRDAFASAMYAVGGKIASTACDFSAPGFNPQTAIAAAVADGADGVLLVPHIDRFDPAIALAQANKGRLPLYGNSTLYTFKTLQFGQRDVNRLVLTVPWHPQANSGDGFPDRANQLWGGSVNWRSAIAYDATQALIAGLRQANTRSQLQQVLRKPEFQAQGTAGPIQFLPSGDRVGTAVLVQVQPGAKSGYDFVPISP
ncbi:MAG: ABC transporter substrate-binding protein [Actinomycetota bacterium]